MLDLFLAKHDSICGGASSARRARFWLETLADVLQNAAAERRSVRAVRSRTGRIHPVRGAALGAFTQDVRFALRRLAHQPGFTLVAVVTLALGVGANAAVFSSVNGVLLQSLGFARPDRLVQVWQSDLSRGVLRNPVPPSVVLEWQRRARGFGRLAAYLYTTANLTGGPDPERIPVAYVSAGFFRTLGIEPAEGRSFDDDDAKEGAAPVVVVSDAFWRRRLGGAASALGTRIAFSGESCTVVGIMPEGFEDLSWRGADVWLPLHLDGRNRSSGGLRVVARLKEGVGPSEARADLAALQAQLSARAAETDNILPDVLVVPLQEEIVRGAEEALVMVQAAALIVLLIMCVNLAGVLLARASTREKEMAIRAAVGAVRWRLVLQFLTESTVLSIAGGVSGLLVAWLGVRALIAALPADMPRLGAIRLDTPVLAAALGLSLITGLLCGVLPAFRAARGDLEGTLRAGGHTSGATRPRALGFFVVIEVALALVLLEGAGLMTRSFAQLQQVNPGFDTSDALAVEMSLSQRDYETPEAQARFFADLEHALMRVPGMRAVGVVNTLPLSQSWGSVPLDVGRGEPARALFYRVNATYFTVMGIPVRGGRGFTDLDRARSAPVAVVSETLARRISPATSAIGQRIRLPWEDTWREVVGIVGDVRHTGIADPPEAGVYVPWAQSPFSRGVVVVRAAMLPDAVASHIRDAVRSLDPNLPLFNVRTLSDLQAEALAPARLVTTLMSGFSLLALALGAVGLYGVIAYGLARRTHEMGVRMALGARRADLLRLFTMQGLKLVLAGLVIGMPATLALSPSASTLLYGVRANDPLTLVGMSVLLIVVGACAAYLPARRATRTDPLTALRVE